MSYGEDLYVERTSVWRELWEGLLCIAIWALIGTGIALMWIGLGS